jgi:hypothetical protein
MSTGNYFYIVLESGQIVRYNKSRVSTDNPIEGKNSINYDKSNNGSVNTIAPENWSHKLSVALERSAEICRHLAKEELKKAKELEEKAEALENCGVDDIEHFVEFSP